MTTRETETAAARRVAAAGRWARGVRDWEQAEPGETTDI